MDISVDETIEDREVLFMIQCLEKALIRKDEFAVAMIVERLKLKGFEVTKDGVEND